VNQRPVIVHTEEHEELGAGFALGALDAADAARLREVLVACPGCQVLAPEYASVAALLPDALDPVEASPSLRDRVLAAARDSSNEGRGTRAQRETPLAIRDTQRATRRWTWALPLAALLAVVLGMGAWNLRLQEQLADQREQIARQQEQVARQAAAVETQNAALEALAAGGRQWPLAGTGRVPGATGVLVEDPAGRPPILVVANMPDPPPGRTYQAWVITAGTPSDAGVLEPTAGDRQVLRLTRPLDGGDTVALTVEPAGGSPSPTGPIVMAARL
jgi:hypothetical protein